MDTRVGIVSAVEACEGLVHEAELGGVGGGGFLRSMPPKIAATRSAAGTLPAARPQSAPGYGRSHRCLCAETQPITNSVPSSAAQQTKATPPRLNRAAAERAMASDDWKNARWCEYSMGEREEIDKWLRATVDPRKKIIWWSREKPRPLGDPDERGAARAAAETRRRTAAHAKFVAAAVPNSGRDLRAEYEFLREKERAKRQSHRDQLQRGTREVPNSPNHQHYQQASVERAAARWGLEQQRILRGAQAPFAASDTNVLRSPPSLSGDASLVAPLPGSLDADPAAEDDEATASAPDAGLFCPLMESHRIEPREFAFRQRETPQRERPSADVARGELPRKTVPQLSSGCPVLKVRGTTVAARELQTGHAATTAELQHAVSNLERLDAAADDYALTLCHALLGAAASESATEIGIAAAGISKARIDDECVLGSMVSLKTHQPSPSESLQLGSLTTPERGIGDTTDGPRTEVLRTDAFVEKTQPSPSEPLHSGSLASPGVGIVAAAKSPNIAAPNSWSAAAVAAADVGGSFVKGQQAIERNQLASQHAKANMPGPMLPQLRNFKDDVDSIGHRTKSLASPATETAVGSIRGEANQFGDSPTSSSSSAMRTKSSRLLSWRPFVKQA